MKCSTIDKRLSLYVYDELEPQERMEMETHLKNCLSCSARLEQYRRLHGLLNDREQHIDEYVPQWDQSWNIIKERLAAQGDHKYGTRRFQLAEIFPSLRMVGTMAMAVVTFLAGLLVGVYVFKSTNIDTSGRQGRDTSPMAQAALQGAHFLRDFQDHLENIKPVIIEYSNLLSEGKGSEPPVQKETVINLLIRNQMLLCRIPFDGQDPRYNRAMQQLLNEMQLILTRIAVLTLNDPDSLSSLKKMIRRKGLLFKMESLRPANEKETAL